MANQGWSCERGAKVLGIGTTSFTRATQDMWEKVAALFDEDAHLTMIEIQQRVAERRRAKQSRQARPQP